MSSLSCGSDLLVDADDDARKIMTDREAHRTATESITDQKSDQSSEDRSYGVLVVAVEERGGDGRMRSTPCTTR